MSKVQQLVALTVLGLLAVLAAGWSLLVQPQRAAAADLRAQTEQQVTENARTRTQLAVLQAQATKLPEQRERLARVAEKIPEGPALPALVRALTAASADSGVEFVSLVPGTAAPLGEAGAAGQLKALPVTLNVVGGYYDIEQYLSELEKLPRALRVVDVALAPGPNPVAGTNAPAADLSDGSSLSATITGSVYLTGEDAVPPAGAQIAPAPADAAGAPAPAAAQ